MPAAVAADSLSKRYGDTNALEDVSLSVDVGSVFALVGPNGAGKTTLVRTVTGTTSPDSGSVTVLGTRPERLDKERIGLLPQSFTPPERLTPRELLTYYAGLYHDARPIDEVLSTVGLEEVGGTWYTNLSGGQQRRTCVGIALVNDPDLLFLDEPTTGIDPAGRQSLWAVIRELRSEGTTVFLTTHYMEEAEELADQVALLDEGEIVDIDRPSALVERYGGGAHLQVEASLSRSQVADIGFEVEITDSGFIVRGVSPAEIGDVVDALETRHIEYDTLTWSESTLEDAYLHLTGESIPESTQPNHGEPTTGRHA